METPYANECKKPPQTTLLMRSPNKLWEVSIDDSGNLVKVELPVSIDEGET